MLHIIREYLIPPPVTRRQKKLAVLVAAFIDFVQIFLAPAFIGGALSPFDLGSDIFAALMLVIICGFKWQFVAGFAFETIPVLSLFPTWLAVAAFIPVKADEPEIGRDVTPFVVSQPPALPEGKKPPVGADVPR